MHGADSENLEEVAGHERAAMVRPFTRLSVSGTIANTSVKTLVSRLNAS